MGELQPNILSPRVLLLIFKCFRHYSRCHWFLRRRREREWWKIAFCTSWRNCRWNYAFVRGETFYILGVFVFHSSGQVVFLFLRLPSEVSEYPKSQSFTGGCTDEQAQQCRFQWQQQHQPMYDFPPVNNRHPRTILQPQSHFCHGNPLPLSCRPPHHNLHGHPHTFPSGQSDFEQSCAKN